MTNAQREIAIASASRVRAWDWASVNVNKLPELAGRKVFSEFHPRNPVEWAILSLSVVGIVIGFRDPAVRIMTGLLLSNVVAVGLTWSVEGRFLVPQLFVFYGLSGVAVGRIFGPRSSSVDIGSTTPENRIPSAPELLETDA